jgi:ammonium transporter, Amt family
VWGRGAPLDFGQRLGDVPADFCDHHPALIVGAIAERMKYSAVILFIGVDVRRVLPAGAHGLGGGRVDVRRAERGAAIKSLDFAGGTVVHMSSGWSALVLCLILGKRLGHGKEPMPPHSMVLVMVGTGMLWVGWYGFNAGSALAADGIAANAFTNTTLAAATAVLCGRCRSMWSKASRACWVLFGDCGGVGGGDAGVWVCDHSGAMLIGVVAGWCRSWHAGS